MGKSLLLVFTLGLLAFTWAEFPKTDIAGNPVEEPEEDIPCPIAKCKEDCTMSCLHRYCPPTCLIDDPRPNDPTHQTCNRTSKRAILKPYLTKQHQKLWNKHRGGSDAKGGTDGEWQQGTRHPHCRYEECVQDDGRCDNKCVKAYCPESCKKEEGVCDRMCKYRSAMGRDGSDGKSKGGADGQWQHGQHNAHCRYEQCVRDDGSCDYECVKDYCPDSCKDDKGVCNRVCKYQSAMAGRGSDGGRGGMARMKEAMGNKWHQFGNGRMDQAKGKDMAGKSKMPTP